eukprot:tig00021572_g22417.t1
MEVADSVFRCYVMSRPASGPPLAVGGLVVASADDASWLGLALSRLSAGAVALVLPPDGYRQAASTWPSEAAPDVAGLVSVLGAAESPLLILSKHSRLLKTTEALPQAYRHLFLWRYPVVSLQDRRRWLPLTPMVDFRPDPLQKAWIAYVYGEPSADSTIIF